MNTLIGGSTIIEGVVPGSCSVAWPRPDVRRWCSRRGSKHQAKAQGRPFPSGGYRREADRTGEALEPLADVSLRSALPVGRWSGAQGLAAEKRQAPAEERAQSGRAPSSSGHRRHPPRSQLVHAKRGNPRRGPALAGKPTVRKAQSLGGNLMTEKRRPAAERQRETGTRMAGPLRLAVLDNRPDTGLRARTRKGADAVR